MGKLFLLGEVTEGSSGIKDFVSSIIGAITSNITMTDVALVLAAIIGAGIVAIFAWKFARKGYNFVKNALSGRSGRI